MCREANLSFDESVKPAWQPVVSPAELTGHIEVPKPEMNKQYI